ncbi:hypothetical protein IU436_27450 [Nocardia farcinica]|uniref:hypothetical protein n=1 Tax=Nocardia TaxID=1817 RepID=UPI00189321A7|nr:MULTISPECIES: hypothetical protein [Nocardia]MBF6215652.1 hypothetical protein [Nocardia puris]MBF6422377.1 hypothetical protein [Nocardia farcinica]MBF6434078.1 hypothetical protein [Nocardia farcinica]MBF6505134.1 hypothetical protein [Nocardia farcinica]
MTTYPFTPAEVALLRYRVEDIGPFLAEGEYAVEGWRRSEGCGGGHGFHYERTKTALVGRRCEWLEDAWYPDGRVRRWRDSRVLWEARITYKRLLAWRETLSFPVIHAARVWWRTAPVWTRDLARLEALTLRQLDALEPPAPEPTDLLDLLTRAEEHADS